MRFSLASFRPRRRQAASGARLTLESLEHRWLPTATFPITRLPGAEAPAVATSLNGESVVAWDRNGRVYAQLFAANGHTLGGVFQVGSTIRSPLSRTLISQATGPQVAMDGRGNFVVVWEYPGLAGGIAARRFTAHGVPRGPAFVVAEGSSLQLDSLGSYGVAMQPNGNFLIASSTNSMGEDTFGADLYSAAGRHLKSIVFPATVTFGGNVEVLDAPSVAATASGFRVVCVNEPADSSELLVFNYSSAGKLRGTLPVPHPAATANQGEENPFLAADAQGHAVLVYQHYTASGVDSTLALAIDPSGTPSPVRVLQAGASSTTALSGVALDPGGAHFVTVQSPQGSHARLSEFNSDGSAQATTDLGPGSSEPAVAVSPRHQYLVVYTVTTRHGIFARRGQLS